MAQCFVADCKHKTGKYQCKFYRFPKNFTTRKKWIRFIRRMKVPTSSSYVCSCHFVDGNKENGPTLFERNAHTRFCFPPPEMRTRKKNQVDAVSPVNEIQLPITQEIDFGPSTSQQFECGVIDKTNAVGTESASEIMPPKKAKQRKKWDPQSMIKAVNAVKYRGMGYLKASKAFSVPRTTLEGYCKKKGTLEDLVQTKLGRKPVFSTDLENQLVSYCLEMEERYYGLTSQDVRRLAFTLAVRNNVSSPFSKTRASAGRKWLDSFKERHPKITFRKPYCTNSFNRENVQKFYEILENELGKINCNPSRIYNVDGTAITTVKHKTLEVISLKCQKEIGALPKSIRESLVTVITCMNAAGDFIPPGLIFQQKSDQTEVYNSQTGAIRLYHPSGWIQTNLFVQWLDHFSKYTQPTKNDPVILVLEGHHSHIRSHEVIDKVRECHILVVCLPPQSSHKLHPIDMSFMESFQRHYLEEFDKWLVDHTNETLTSNQISDIVDKVYAKAATVETAINGFTKCGIYPLNSNHLKDEDFPEVLSKTIRDIDNTDINEYKTPNYDQDVSEIFIKTEEIPSEPGPSGIMLAEIKIEPTLSCKSEHTNDDQDNSEDDEDDECFLRSGLLFVDKNNERWIKCNLCYKWYHGKCVGRQENENYICDFCYDI